MNIAIIMAGGTGSRMSAGLGAAPGTDPIAAPGTKTEETALPKQFIDLGGRPIIMHTLSRFLESGCFNAIYIGMHPDWVEYMGDLIYGKGLDIPAGGLHIISGGDDRNSTLLNVLDAIESDLRDAVTSDTAYDGSDDPNTDEYDPIIVTHDAVRPFITTEMIENTIDAARRHAAATLANPTTDTIASASHFANPTEASTETDATCAFVSSIPDRSTLYNIQTPQSFKLSSFREAYSALSDEQINALTDVCGIFSATGKPVAIVPGAPSNIKITTPFDLEIAKSLI